MNLQEPITELQECGLSCFIHGVQPPHLLALFSLSFWIILEQIPNIIEILQCVNSKR